MTEEEKILLRNLSQDEKMEILNKTRIAFCFSCAMSGEERDCSACDIQKQINEMRIDV